MLGPQGRGNGSPEYEVEDRRLLCGLDLDALLAGGEEDLAAVQRATPTIPIHSGADKFARWMRIADICEWHLVVGLDLHFTVDHMDIEKCADLYHRLKTVPNVKIIIVTYFRDQHHCSFVLSRMHEWQWLVEWADGIVIVTDEVPEGRIDSEGVTVTTLPLEHPKVICMNGGKGDLLGISAVPGVLVDDNLRHLSHWMYRGKAPSAGILVPGPDWYFVEKGLYALEEDIVMLAHHQAWVMVIRTFYCQSVRMGWADQSKMMAAQRADERISLDVHTSADQRADELPMAVQPDARQQPGAYVSLATLMGHIDRDDSEYSSTTASTPLSYSTAMSTTLSYDGGSTVTDSEQAVQPDAYVPRRYDTAAQAVQHYLSYVPRRYDTAAPLVIRPLSYDTDTTSLAVPATVTDPVEDMWAIECIVDDASGELWPAYRHGITGLQWIRPDAVPIARAAADFEGALSVWRAKTPPEEVAKVETAGIVRNFNWGREPQWQ